MNSLLRHLTISCAIAICCGGVFLLSCLEEAPLTAVEQTEAIPKPDDAPKPYSPEKAASLFKLPAELQMELVASEPLIREPSGVCWDQKGRLFVCELHGYNLNGQLDIDEQNKTGKLDKVVRRFFVPKRIEEAAKAGTYGTVKQLIDTDGDGRMDKASVWADHIPPCLGICPARDGIIVACSPDILFLADRDGDGIAEVREVLFTGFKARTLERRMGNPQWGLDDWIYFGRSFSATTVTGPHLSKPVQLPATDFRIKADGSAIEPVAGYVEGQGFTFTEFGDRFVSPIGWPASFIVPLPWHALARNPYVVTPTLTVQAFPSRRAYPTSKAHPWRTRRAQDPGFSKFYTEGWGIAESAPNGYFTSCCGPLVYQDNVLPGLHGQLLACEPAQNLIHRSLIQRDRLRLLLRRKKSEETSEFLTTTDSWFHPIALSHGPDGCVYIADFYREIIEDYSAIPRYLQQQYGLSHGKNYGRIWRIAAKNPPPLPSPDMSKLSPEELAAEVGSALFWRRQTARRLLTEGQSREVAPTLIKMAQNSHSTPVTIVNALHTLDSLGQLKPEVLVPLLKHTSSGVRRQVLQLAERWLEEHDQLLNAALSLKNDAEPIVRFQLAISLGASNDRRILPTLAELARRDCDDSWMRTAILSGLRDRGGKILSLLLNSPKELNQARFLLEPLCFAIGSRREPHELNQALLEITTLDDLTIQEPCLQGIQRSFNGPATVQLDKTTTKGLKGLADGNPSKVQSLAQLLVRLMKLETPEERAARVMRLKQRLQDVTVNVDDRIAAVTELSAENDATIGPILIKAIPSATPSLRSAILQVIFSRRDYLPDLLDAIEQKIIPKATISAVQREMLLNDKNPEIRSRANKLLSKKNSTVKKLIPQYIAALNKPRDVVHGREIFVKICGKCHQAHNQGVAVGPDLSSEFQRAEETIIEDILAPSQNISSAYVTYVAVTQSGQVFTGLLASESPTSITLKQPEGKQQVILRNEIEELRASDVSMMPEDLVKTLKPQDVADVIAWLRQPQDRVLLLEDDPSLATALTDGPGTAKFITGDKYSGDSSLLVTPPQRGSAQIKGWAFRIRENPAPGEYRYIRFVWKAPQAVGVMLELADKGQWPPSDQPIRRYFAGRNLTEWQAVAVAPRRPENWTVVTRDLWKDFGDFTLTGIAPTAIGGPALFDHIELLRKIDPPAQK